MSLSSLRVDPNAAMPLWAQVGEQLRWHIVRGDLRTDDRLPAMRSLADELGIHLHTVRAAYESLEAAGLVARRRGVGTVVVDFDATALTTSLADLPTFTVGVILAGYSPFYGPLLDGIESGAQDRGSSLLLANARDDARSAARYLTEFAVRGVDGVVVVSVGLDPEPPAGVGPPLVRADRPDAPQPSLTFDLVDGVATAARHLADHGHRRIGLLAPPSDWNNGLQIREGFALGARTAGLAAEDAVIEVLDGYATGAGERAARRLLGEGDPVSGLIAAGDVPAVAAIGVARSYGRSVPQDLAVIGTGDIELAAAVDPPLTTIALPAREMGARAVSLLATGAGGGQPPVVLPTALIRRRSCGCS